MNHSDQVRIIPVTVMAMKIPSVKGCNKLGSQQVKKDSYPITLEVSGSRMDATKAIICIKSAPTAIAVKIQEKENINFDP